MTSIKKEQFPLSIQNWLDNLQRLNIHVEDLCYENFLTLENQEFHQIANEEWKEFKKGLSIEKPVAIQAKNKNYFIGYLMAQHNDVAYLGLLIRPPINDMTLELIRTTLGWLFYEQQGKKLAQAWNAQHLLEIFAYVMNQSNGHIATQEWINRTTTYIRTKYPKYENIQLSYFTVKNEKTIKWCVSSELAWVEKGSVDLQSINEIALRTLLLQQQIQQYHWWTYPIFYQGRINGIVVAKDRAFEQGQPIDLSLYLKNNVELIHPLLHFWSISEQSFIQHNTSSMKKFFQKYSSQGNYAWKIITIILALILLAITCIPVNKLVTANLNVEGKTRWIISAPTQGFIENVYVRPGDQVKKNQLLMELDDSELTLQLAEQKSLLDQAQHQFRVAMAEQNLTDSGLAANQIQQQEAKIENTQQKLLKTRIVAPLEGTIINGDWIQQIGTPLENGKEIFQIASQDAYKVILHVADKDINLVKNGQNGVLKLTSLPDQSFAFKIIKVTPVAVVENNINGFKVEAEWIESPPALTPGMQGIGKVTVGKTNLLMRWSRDFMNWLKLKMWSAW